jgi:hypothetical protein
VTPAPPNVFQRLARRWDAVHPYNAGQACRVAGAFSLAEATAAWTGVVRALGVGSGQASCVERLPDDVDLSQHFTRELNRPFTKASPFRPFVLKADGSTWFGIVYRHAVADSVSIRGVLHAWLARLGAVAGGEGPPPHLLSCRSRDLLRRRRGDWRVNETLLRLLRRYGENRRVRKIHTFGPLDYPVRVRLFPAPPGIVPGLIAHARAHSATVNDVLVAVLARACHQLVPAQQRRGRSDLAVSSVADLRPGLVPSLNAGFGCLLGFTSTVCRRRDLDDWDHLLRGVAAQSAVQRRAGVGPASVLWMLAAEFAARYTPADRVYDFYRKEIPLAAGISNVNLNGTWVVDDAPGSPVLDYVRVSPTGPIVPIALAVTSLGTELRLALTYRTALLNDWTASDLMQSFGDQLEWVGRRGGPDVARATGP